MGWKIVRDWAEEARKRNRTLHRGEHLDPTNPQWTPGTVGSRFGPRMFDAQGVCVRAAMTDEERAFWPALPGYSVVETNEVAPPEEDDEKPLAPTEGVVAKSDTTQSGPAPEDVELSSAATTYECSLCGKVVASSQGLKIHVARMHRSPE